MTLRKLMCRYYDFKCPNYSEDEEVDGAGGSEGDDVLGDDNIDFVEEDAGQGGMPSCSVDPDTGAFGTTGSGGDKDYVETIVFQYQVQTVVNLTANDFAFDKLPAIEQALSNLMVPDIFLGSLCGESGRRRRAMARVRAGGHVAATPTSFTKMRRAVPPPPPLPPPLRRALLELPIGASDLDGLDSKPNDLIAPGLDGVRCRTALVPGAERCFVVNGGLTLHGFSDITWARPIALEIVKLHMDNGDLNSVDGHVVDVRFLTTGAPVVDDDANLYPPPPTSGGGSDGARDDPGAASASSASGPLAWPWIVLGCGVVLFAVSLVMWRRRRRSEIDEAASLDSAEKALYDPEGIEDPYLRDTKVAVHPSTLNSSPMLLPSTSTSPRVFQSPSEDESEDDSDAGLMYRQRQRHFI